MSRDHEHHGHRRVHTANGGSVLGQFDTDAYQVGDNLTLVRGSHQMTLGGDVAYWQSDSLDGQRGGGVWQFNGSVDRPGTRRLFDRQCCFRWGRPGRASCRCRSGTSGRTRRIRGARAAAITLNAGLRWEPFLGQNVRNNAIYNFSRENYQQRIRSTVFPNAPLGLDLSRRSRLPLRPVGARQAVGEPGAARRHRLGCDRRRPHGGAIVVRAGLRLHAGGVPLVQRHLRALLATASRSERPRAGSMIPTATGPAGCRTRCRTL